MKKMIWGGMMIGTTIGGVVPFLWGSFGFTFSAAILSFIGGIFGIWAGYKMAKYFGV